MLFRSHLIILDYLDDKLYNILSDAYPFQFNNLSFTNINIIRRTKTNKINIIFSLFHYCHYQMRTKHGASAEAVDEIGANSLLVG